jgi:hypothetical protein
MQMLDPFALRLPGGSSPQSALGEPGMGAQILLIFGARLLLHQRHIVLEGHRLSIQAFDGNRLDASSWLPDVEALLGGVHPAGNSLASQASAHIGIFSVDRQLPIRPDRPRKGLLIDLHEPAIRIDRLWNALERREGQTGHTRRLVATGACEGSAAGCWSGRDTPKSSEDDLLSKVNYFRTELQIRNADQTPCLMTESSGKEKGSWSTLRWFAKRASNDNKNENACQLRADGSCTC